MTDRYDPLLPRAAALALEYLEGVAERPVAPPVDPDSLAAALSGPLPERGEDPLAVIETLAHAADPGVTATAGPRYFGFVTGGSLPAAVAADWLTSAWDQMGGLYVCAPAGAVVERTVAGWIVDLFGLPAGTGVGLTTGCTMANFTALAAARNAALAPTGWDVETQGLFGAPGIEIVIGEEAHASIFSALQMLGLGRDRVTRIAADGEGRMRADALAEALAGIRGPTIVCAQAGNVNTGAFDPLAEIAGACREHGAWLHVDGAFGLWAAASPALRHHVAGIGLAQSWAVDGHKWLNVPYDCGIVMVADAEAHRKAMTISGSYLVKDDVAALDATNWVPEASRRLRGFAVWVALRSLGREGVAALVERCCALARRMADRLGAEPGIEILNDVVINQVLVRFAPAGADPGEPGEAADAFTRAVIAAVQREGTCWAGGTLWHGMAAMRISVSNWSTSEADADRSAEAILACCRAAGE